MFIKSNLPNLPVATQQLLAEASQRNGQLPDDNSRVLSEFISRLNENFLMVCGYEVNRRRDFEDVSEDDLKELVESGIVSKKIPDDQFRGLANVLSPIVDTLRQRHADMLSDAGNEKLRMAFAELCFRVEPGSDVFAYTSNLLEELGVVNLLSAYVGTSLAVKAINVQRDFEQYTSSKYGQIDPDGFPENKYDYLHIDSEVWPHVKVLMYLTDPVGLDQGPFRYVPGSHNEVSLLERLVRQTVDELDLKGDRYASLPEVFKMRRGFAKTLGDGYQQTLTEILGREIACTSDKGNLLILDSNGIHRGGFVRDGERMMMQVTLKRKD